MAGHRVDATTDVCVIDGRFILLVQEAKELKFLMTSQRQDHMDIELQLVVEVIAAFHQNKMNRKLAGLSKLANKLMPGIVM